MKLYTAKTVTDFHRGGIVYHGTEIIFNCCRETPPAPYEELIAHYTKCTKCGYEISEQEKAYASEYVDTFFTEEEIKLLRDYIKRTDGSELIVDEVSLPITGGIFYPDSDLCRLWAEEGYDLPFKVEFSYNLGNATCELDFSREVAHLRDALKTLNLDFYVPTDEKLMDAARALHSKSGWSVHKDRPVLKSKACDPFPIDDDYDPFAEAEAESIGFTQGELETIAKETNARAQTDAT